MRKLFAIIFGAVIIFLISLIVSLIPMSIIGDFALNYAKKQSIEFEAKSSWNLRLFGLKATTNKFEYNIKLNRSKIYGHGENFIYGIYNNSVEIENLLLEVDIEDSDNLNNIIQEILNKMRNSYYNFTIKSLIINIISNNDKKQKSLVEEILLSDVNIIKQKDKKQYSLKIAINKDKETSFLLTTDKLNSEHYELNAKIENDDFFCYIYDAKKGGNINCLAKNLLTSLRDIGFNKIDDDVYKKILNKRISFKANLYHKNGIVIDGNLMLNNDLGKILYDSENNILNINFENINFDKTYDDIKDLFKQENEENQDKKNEYIMMMSGKENKFLSNAKKKQTLENINSLNKVVVYLINFANNIGFQTNINIKKAIFNGVDILNLSGIINKETNGLVKFKNFSFHYGNEGNGKLIINSVENGYNRFFLLGDDNIKTSLDLLNINIFNKQNSNHLFRSNFDFKLYINSFELKNGELFFNDKKIINFDLFYSYNFENKESVKNKKIIINNGIELEKIFDFIYIYHYIYNSFESFQQQEKQDAVFWKLLFKKRNQDYNCSENFNFFIDDVYFYGKKINNFVVNYKNTNYNTNLSVVSQNDFINAEYEFDLKNIDGKETVRSTINSKNINLTNFDNFFNDIKKATGKNFSDIFKEDRDYNIPSLIGVSGIIKIDIENIISDILKVNDIKGDINIIDGIISAENFSFLYKNGKFDVNLALSLQGRPDLQIAFVGSGVDIDSLLNSPLDGYVSLQCSLKSFGFNPIKFIKNISGKGKIVVQNLKIPKFDLLNMSKEVMINGVRNNIDYKKIISDNDLFFSKGEGNILFENGILKADLVFSRELVSGSAEMEYNFLSKIINKLSGSFATMMVRKQLETPFAIYIPFACNGKVENPECIIDWKQLDETIKVYTS